MKRGIICQFIWETTILVLLKRKQTNKIKSLNKKYNEQNTFLILREPNNGISKRRLSRTSTNFFTDATSGNTGTNKLTHGTVAGNKVEISCPTSDVGAPSYTDTDGIQMLELPYVAVPNSGNDEVSIKFF